MARRGVIASIGRNRVRDRDRRIRPGGVNRAEAP